MRELHWHPNAAVRQLDTWMALTPHELLDAHLKLEQQVMAGLRKTKMPVVPAWNRRSAPFRHWS
jgi:hypothetical protein